MTPKQIAVAFALATALAFAPEQLTAQELQLLNNGEVADAEVLNDNFAALGSAIGKLPYAIEDHVMLKIESSATSSCVNDQAYRRISLNGSLDPNEFVVPAGRVLLITDVSWSGVHGTATFVPGRVLQMLLTSRNPDGSNFVVIYYSPKIEITEANKNGRLGANENLTTGAIVGPGRIVCSAVGNQSQQSSSTNSISNSILMGYLVDAPPQRFVPSASPAPSGPAG
ncbi:MAG: hypothetical protein AAFY29_15425 [Pseudomonadota bacterium]